MHGGLFCSVLAYFQTFFVRPFWTVLETFFDILHFFKLQKIQKKCNKGLQDGVKKLAWNIQIVFNNFYWCHILDALIS